ncbi:GH92 family glycosyl hydrolase [Mycobacterium cookii]|uniref:Putative glycosidase n=1 Tax=Mycobacterium cookii TaxID=1775 RepID=A0A7I7L0Z3_9MYCO|nr:GH92 family glycosyl hydrolase [Mycobacterium cookii]MCV7329895.1 glycoside hydrolase family 92 protein [Mycobacterium cookii]BBX48040.1 putative glycosidase [Mycobacterium cookii]
MRSRRGAVALVTAALLVSAMLVSATPTSYEPPEMVAKPVDHVNTLIGTGNGGKTVGEINNFPGPSVPFGMVQYSPDTVDNYAGYSHSNDHATGFSMTHASVGCAAFGDISMLPTTGPVGVAPWDASEEIAHDDHEVGVPGYYSVRLPSADVTAELTATRRTGVGRFHFPRHRPARFLVRSGSSLGGTSADKIKIEGDNTTITGSATTGGFCGKDNVYTVYFAMKFSKPFINFGTWDGTSIYPKGRSAYASYQGSSGGYVEFPAGSEVEVRTALSYVDVDGARKNLDEAAESFDDVRAAASTQWNDALSRIRIAGYTEDDIVTFYSALYHALLNPNTFNDADGRYIGFDNNIHTVDEGHTQFANFSDWDTYRGVAALQGLVFPQEASDMAQSLVNDAEQSGSYPRWALANTATAEMTGDSVVPLIANFFAFGAKDFDVHRALRFMLDAAKEGGAGRNGYVERPEVETYLRRGYLPLPTTATCRGSFPAASISLEWSVDDFAISQFAAALGDSAAAADFQDRAQYWQNLFNPTTHSISPRNALGFFRVGPAVVPPAVGCFSQVGFDEGNAEQYVWYVPQNVAGLVTALGGRQAVADRLDKFTSQLNVGPEDPYLWAGNEPDFGVPWLYNYIGQPWKTQELVDRIRSTLFSPTPDGEPGNDDLGAMSAWYVWAAMGLYPSVPGTSVLTVNTPLFDRIEIALPAGKSIRISAPGASGHHRMQYISSLHVDGRSIDQTYLPAGFIESGGELAFSLSVHPNTTWGTAASSAPPSFGAGSLAVTVNVSPAVVTVDPGRSTYVTVNVQRMVDGPGEYTISAKPYDGISAKSVSGKFGDDGSATATVTIKVAESAPAGYYPLTLTTKAGKGERTFTLLVAVGEGGVEGG